MHHCTGKYHTNIHEGTFHLSGHSLGAGAAVVLAALLRPQYPALKCFAFSPPGGLCSKDFALATQVSLSCA